MAIARPAVFSVCTATKSSEREIVTIRGTGALSREMTSRGAVALFDYTCPLGTGNEFTLPSAVLVESPRFADTKMEAKFRTLRPSSVFQALVRGRLECVKRFKVEKGDDGDIIGGNGYGYLNLFRCRMQDATFLTFHILDTE